MQARLRRDLDNARWLADQVARRPDWRVLAPVPLQTVCVRHEPPGLDGDALDQAHARLGRAGQPLRRRLPDPGDAGRPVDGPGLDRRRADGAPARRGALAVDSPGGRATLIRE